MPAPDRSEGEVVPIAARGSADVAPAAVDLDDLNSPHTLAVLAVPPGATVLDVGCGPGVVARALTARGCQVWGLEIDARKADHARAHCVEVEQADLDSTRPSSLFGGRRFDAILCLDVLEHLREPDGVLSELATLLAPGGVVVISVPNVTHGALRLELLRGRFAYRRSGLLDRGHLRFFDREALQDLIRHAGLRADTTLRVIRRLDQTEFDIDPDSIPAAVRDQLEIDPDALTYQFFVIARPARGLPADGHVVSLPERLRQRLDEVTAELDKAGVYARHLEAELLAKDDGLRLKGEQADEIARLAGELERADARAVQQGLQVDALTREIEKAGTYSRRLEAELSSRNGLATELERAHVLASEQAAQLAALTRGIEQSRREAREQSTHARLLEAELERARTFVASQTAHVEIVSKELERAGGYARKLEAELESADASVRRAEQDLASRIVELETRRAELEGMARTVDRMLLERAELQDAVSMARSDVTRLEGSVCAIGRDLEAGRRRQDELDRTIEDQQRLLDDGAAYVRHLEGELQQRTRDIAVRDDELSVARVHIEKTGQAMAERDSHVSEVEAYVRHLEGELQARVNGLADRDAALQALRSDLGSAECRLNDLQIELQAQQARAERLMRALDLPRHRLVTAWGDAFMRRLPSLHRLLRPLAAGAARRWGSSREPS